MYLSHFGLSQLPFGITPDTEFVVASRGHVEGMNLLHMGLQSGEGFIKIVGEVGTGKTLLCRKFLAELGPDWKAAYVPNPQMEPRDFLLEIAEELDSGAGAPEAPHVIKRINQRLIELAAQDLKVVLCIDEAQTMPRMTLESLRLLSNLETEKRKLLHIVLFGQPELDEMLAAHSARQLRQRIVFHHTLKSLDPAETAVYVGQRIETAGHRGGKLFPERSLKALHRYAFGTPRLINILGHKALMLAFGEGRPQVLVRHIKAAARDTDSAIQPARWWPW